MIAVPLGLSARTENGKGWAVLDECDSDLASLRWAMLPGKRTTYAYRKVPGNRASELLHRVVLERKLGRTLLPGEVVDHVNGDGCFNTRANLRVASYQENARSQTRPRRGKRFKGVYLDPRGAGWYVAQIRLDGRTRHIGMFATEEEAARAYDAAALEHYGEFARPNFPKAGV